MEQEPLFQLHNNQLDIEQPTPSIGRVSFDLLAVEGVFNAVQAQAFCNKMPHHKNSAKEVDQDDIVELCKRVNLHRAEINAIYGAEFRIAQTEKGLRQTLSQSSDQQSDSDRDWFDQWRETQYKHELCKLLPDSIKQELLHEITDEVYGVKKSKPEKGGVLVMKSVIAAGVIGTYAAVNPLSEERFADAITSSLLLCGTFGFLWRKKVEEFIALTILSKKIAKECSFVLSQPDVRRLYDGMVRAYPTFD